MRKRLKLLLRRGVAASTAVGLVIMQAGLAGANGYSNNPNRDPNAYPTSTPIKHLVIIYGENVSFDHYFATYPSATNPSGEPYFVGKQTTPTVNGLAGGLLTANPNFLNTGNAGGAANPFRLDRSQAATNDQDHDYAPEQQAFDHGLMDLFPRIRRRRRPAARSSTDPRLKPLASRWAITMATP